MNFIGLVGETPKSRRIFGNAQLKEGFPKRLEKNHSLISYEIFKGEMVTHFQ